MDIYPSTNLENLSEPEAGFKIRPSGIAWAKSQAAFPDGHTLVLFAPYGRDQTEYFRADDKRAAAIDNYNAADTRIRRLATALLQDVVFAPDSIDC